MVERSNVRDAIFTEMQKLYQQYSCGPVSWSDMYDLLVLTVAYGYARQANPETVDDYITQMTEGLIERVKYALTPFVGT